MLDVVYIIFTTNTLIPYLKKLFYKNYKYNNNISKL